MIRFKIKNDPISMYIDDESVTMQVERVSTVIYGDRYEGEYEIIPSVNEDQKFQTANKVMKEDLTVFKMPYAEVSNSVGGMTVTIG